MVTFPPRRGGTTMTDAELELHSRRTNRLVAIGIVLIGVSGAAGFLGMTLAALGAAATARRRIQQMEVPPNELARKNWMQMRAAFNAGARAWRDDYESLGSGSQVPPG